MTSLARKCDSIHWPEISLTSMSRKCDSMDTTGPKLFRRRCFENATAWTTQLKSGDLHVETVACQPVGHVVERPRHPELATTKNALPEFADACWCGGYVPRHPADKMLEPTWLRTTTTPERTANLVDSRVTLGTRAKGRSSARYLNQALRASEREQTWPQNLSRTTGLVLQCRLPRRSAPQQSISKAIS